MNTSSFPSEDSAGWPQLPPSHALTLTGGKEILLACLAEMRPVLLNALNRQLLKFLEVVNREGSLPQQN